MSLTELNPEEYGVFELGDPIDVPLQIRTSGFCFHAAVWFATGLIPNVPEWSSWNGATRQYVENALSENGWHWRIVFETSSFEGIVPVRLLDSLDSGVYLVQLLDVTLNSGHWILLDTAKGVFDPGTAHANIPLQRWVSFLGERFRVRRTIRLGDEAQSPA